MTRWAGEYYAVARFETQFPIGLPEEYGIEFGAFLDAGSVWGLNSAHVGSGTSQASANTIYHDDFTCARWLVCRSSGTRQLVRCALTLPMRLRLQNMTLSRILISPFRRLSDGCLRRVSAAFCSAAHHALGAPRGAFGGAGDLYISGGS